MKRVVPKVKVSDGKVLTLFELSRAKDAAITRSPGTLRVWIERGVISHTGLVVHLPHLRIGKYYHSSVSALAAFLDVLQDCTHSATAALTDAVGPPVIGLKGDPFEKRGLR